jgi:hypothetical protein
MPQDSAVPLPRQMTTPGRRVEWRAAWRAFRVAAVYAVLAAVWLLAYGRGPVIPLQGPLGAVNVWHIFQGWLYVVLTATLLYALLREHDAALARERGRPSPAWEGWCSLRMPLPPWGGRSRI